MKPRSLSLFSAPNSVNRRRIHGSVAHELAVAIIGGRLKPGDVLPNEEQLSAELSVSRTAYREAIKILSGKGLVSMRPRTGTRVSPRSNWNMLDPDVLSWHFQVELSPAFIESLFELRRIVEPAAAALSARRRSVADLDLMRTALDGMGTAPHASVEGLDADIRFHMCIFSSTGNEALASLRTVVESTLRWSASLTLTANPLAHRDSLPQHQAVFDAIAAGNEKRSFDRMADLIESALKDTLESLKSRLP